MMFLPLDETYWRNGTLDKKAAKVGSVLTPIQLAVKTLGDVAALRDEIKHLESRLTGDEGAEVSKSQYGQPESLLPQLERAADDAHQAMAEARDCLLRISRALFGSE